MPISSMPPMPHSTKTNGRGEVEPSAHQRSDWSLHNENWLPSDGGHRARALDWLVALRCAGVVSLDAQAVDNHAAADGDVIGLRTQRLAHHRGKLSPDTSRPARSAEVGVRWRAPNLTRIRGGHEHRIQLFANQPFDVGWRLGRRGVAGFGARELRHRRAGGRDGGGPP